MSAYDPKRAQARETPATTWGHDWGPSARSSLENEPRAMSRWRKSQAGGRPLGSYTERDP